MKQPLEHLVEKQIGKHLSGLAKLHGDASYRIYYRATTEDGGTYIVMQMPAGKQSVSEEITNFNGTHEELPFVNVTQFLASIGMPVPAIRAEDKDNRILILEDLGDTLMAHLVAGKSPEVQRAWYAKAIELLVTLQERTLDHRDKGCIAFARSFDRTLYTWEFEHFREYGIEVRLGTSMTNTDRTIFDDETKMFADEIAALPYGFTHRDFQSRNLLFHHDKLFLIDYQDALMGPMVYDLVALLRDSYVVLPPELVRELVALYARRRGLDAHSVQQQFDLVTIQRKLKDAGRFVFIERVKGNPSFMQYIPASLGYVKEAFERLENHARLYEMLKKYVPEWR